MRNQEVVFTERNIHFKDNERSVVMDAASKYLMEFYSMIVCQHKGITLDVGFGMGYSAEKMSELSSHYHCIEINPQIYEKALEWAATKDNVTIHYGDWTEIIPKLALEGIKFDGIFMDTHHDPHYLEFENYAKMVSNEDCILSIFNYFTLRDPSTLNEYPYRLDSGKFTKLVTPVHHIHWAHFRDGEYVKGPKFTLPKPTKLL